MKNPVPRKIPPSGKQALDVTSSSCLGGGGITSLSCFWGGRVGLLDRIVLSHCVSGFMFTVNTSTLIWGAESARTQTGAVALRSSF